MQHTPLINEERLEANSEIAETRGILPELMFRLIATTIQNPTELRIPYGGSIGQPGWDGIVSSPIPFDPYVPQGPSFWEFGAGGDPQDKATRDFTARDGKTSAEEKAGSTFVFVTTRSGVRTWDIDKQRAWIKARAANGWKDLRIIDGTKLAQWLALFPEVDFWLAEKFQLPTKGLTTPALAWEKLRKYGDPPPLKAEVFTAGRDVAKTELLRLFEGQTRDLRIDCRYPDEGVDFICAVLAGLDPPRQAAYAGRCLIIKDSTTWEVMCMLKTPHVLIADPILDVGGNGSDLRAQARARGHNVIFASTPSAATHGNPTRLTEYRPYELQISLAASGYAAERARQLADRCGGSIYTLKRILLDVSVAPEWATNTAAADLKIANLIGRWDGDNARDRQAMETAAGKSYGEWIGVIRQTTLRPNAPLMQRNEKWRFVSRFEGWQFLGPLLSNDDLDTFRRLAVEILGERDPKLELPADERWSANILNPPPRYSHLLREGVAETLALLGSYPTALSTASTGRAVAMTDVSVRDILAELDWKGWASLQDVLPLLAEAGPDQFLRAIETDLAKAEPDLVALFGQESPAFTGRNYMTGLLWALETLAWNRDYLTRVTLALGKLASHDPGGQWSNRPGNSLASIFLPWLPQTTAPAEKRRAALLALLREFPAVGWKLLLELLPDTHQVSSGTAKPSWREWIPPNADDRVSEREYWNEIQSLAGLAAENAATDLGKLNDLIARLNHLPEPAREEILRHLTSDAVLKLDDAARFPLWQSLMDLVVQHRRYPDAEWAMAPELVTKLASAASAIAPRTMTWRHRRLFSGREFDLVENSDDYSKQQAVIAEWRQSAIAEIFAAEGVDGVLAFAREVTESWKVGVTFGATGTAATDTMVLPKLLTEELETVRQFISGYVWGRFRQEGWDWAEKVVRETTAPEHRIAFLVLLPFQPDGWRLAHEVLGEREAEYWLQTNADPFQCPPEALPDAIGRLLAVKRATAALRCLGKMLREDHFAEPDVGANVLEAILTSDPLKNPHDAHECLGVIRWLQKHPPADRRRLQRIEWAFLPLLDRHSGASPQTLEQELANDPAFFSEAIRTVFRPEGAPKQIPLDDETKNRAMNAYRLLRGWRIVPGRQPDGSIDGTQLVSWLTAVKDSTRASGHFKIAMSQFGQVLASAPRDPDGTWISHPVARVLDASDAAEIREGFQVAKFNGRGVYSSTKGRAESNLAGNYRQQADAVDGRYPRLAATMRDLAQSYERMAEREAQEDPFDR